MVRLNSMARHPQVVFNCVKPLRTYFIRGTENLEPDDAVARNSGTGHFRQQGLKLDVYSSMAATRSIGFQLITITAAS